MQYAGKMSNVLCIERRAQVVSCLVEGMSIRATVRVTGVAKNTTVNLLADLGAACAEYQDAALRTSIPRSSSAYEGGRSGRRHSAQPVEGIARRHPGLGA